ncbi:MAG: hypothetical protein FWF10_12110 [Clostridiales bacterium]|nr:hypothetical protein [Clostridiales bacterium]
MNRFGKALRALVAILFVSFVAVILIMQSTTICDAFNNGDVYQHSIATLSLLISFVALVGGFAVSREFSKRKRDALYGCWINLETMLCRLRDVICLGNGNPHYDLYKSMSNHDTSLKVSDNAKLKVQTKDCAVRILNYLSVQNNIVPPGKGRIERKTGTKPLKLFAKVQ